MSTRADVYARPDYVTLVIICCVVGTGILIMCGMAFLLIPARIAKAAPETVLPVLLVLEVAALRTSIGIRRRFVASALDTSHRPTHAHDVAGTREIDDAMYTIRVGVILATVVSAVPAVLGLAYLAAGGTALWIPAFFGGAIMAWAMAFPRPSEWRDWLDALQSAAPDASDGADASSAPSLLQPQPQRWGSRRVH